MTTEPRFAMETEAIAQVLAATAGRPLLPTRAERAHWQQFTDQPIAREVMDLAAQALAEPTPAITATSYLTYQRTGNRVAHEVLVDGRRARLIHMVLAECLEAEGRFLDAILDEAWAICEESSWVIPAHAGGRYPDGLWDPDVPIIDLWSAMDVLMLAEVDTVLGDALHPALRKRIRYEVRRRGTEPALARDDYYWSGPLTRASPNWAPVCAGGVAGAALHLEPDAKLLARVLEMALRTMDHYRDTFHADGGCAEGVGYWEKGFGYFTIFADLLAKRTDGQVDLLAHPFARRVGAYPLKVSLSPGRYVGFSDTAIDRAPQAALLHRLAAGTDQPALMGLDHAGSAGRQLTKRYPPEKLRDFVWYPGHHQAAAIAPDPVDHLPDIGWLVARATPSDPDGLALAVKAGHNGEPHNHNDVGSFMVHWRGESLVAELGAEPYSAKSFKADTRYRIFNNRSLGHSVPLVDGHEQMVGAAHAAGAVKRLSGADGDGLAMDLAGAYPADLGLEALWRQVALRRAADDRDADGNSADDLGTDGRGWVHLSDVARFAGPAKPFETALITFADVVMDAPGVLRLVGERGALKVLFDADSVAVDCQPHPAVRLRFGVRDVTRIAFRVRAAVPEPAVTLRIVPIR